MEVISYEKRVNDFNIGDEHYAIGEVVLEDGTVHHVAINYNYCDENGMLKESLNGLQMHLSDNLHECIKSVKMSYFARQGYSIEQLCKMFD